jgi:O-antigen/teichoic acid export membrane protein
LCRFVSIRTLLIYLGEERYAVYTIALSLTLWFNLADFGLGFSIQNFISEARAKKESYEKYIIATLQIIVFLLTVALLAVILISYTAQEIIFRKFDSVFILDCSRVSVLISKLARIPKIIGANITFNENVSDPLTKYYTDISYT